MRKVLPSVLISLFLTIGGIASAGVEKVVTPPLIVDIIGALEKVIALVFTILLIGAVIALMVAGIIFITSGGDPGKVGTARTLVLYALIAVVIGLLARGLVLFLERYFR